MNSWPNDHRRAMSQSAHQEWNSAHYPGTRQMCVTCDCETERCEEDSIYVGDLGPLCLDCAAKEQTP